MLLDNVIDKLKQVVKERLEAAESGHDWWHTLRVFNNAQQLQKSLPESNAFIVDASALLHDIADAKFNNGDETEAGKLAVDILTSLEVPEESILKIVYIIEHLSYRHSFNASVKVDSSIELKIVQDADRLDAIGAIGIARAFNYGGFVNRPFYDPEIAPRKALTKEEYTKPSPTINHFFEKLLLLKDGMQTEMAKKMAEERHEFMVRYLHQFFNEWNGK